jgi:hypothetical protein
MPVLPEAGFAGEGSRSIDRIAAFVKKNPPLEKSPWPRRKQYSWIAVGV